MCVLTWHEDNLDIITSHIVVEINRMFAVRNQNGTTTTTTSFILSFIHPKFNVSTKSLVQALTAKNHRRADEIRKLFISWPTLPFIYLINSTISKSNEPKPTVACIRKFESNLNSIHYLRHLKFFFLFQQRDRFYIYI